MQKKPFHIKSLEQKKKTVCTTAVSDKDINALTKISIFRDCTPTISLSPLVLFVVKKERKKKNPFFFSYDVMQGKCLFSWVQQQ